MSRKRRIIVDSESDEDFDAHSLQTPSISKAVVPDVSMGSRLQIPLGSGSPKKSESDAEGEWKPIDIKEAMGGMSDDKEVVPWKVTAEQIGDDGVEYFVAFQNKVGTKKYKEWVAERDLTEDMKILKDDYEKAMATSRSHKRVRPSYVEQQESGSEASAPDLESEDTGNSDNSESDLSEPCRTMPSSNQSSRKASSASRRARDTSKTKSSAEPALPTRRSSRSSATNRRAVTRQKLDDLMELRHRSKQGIGALHDFSGDSESSDEDADASETRIYDGGGGSSTNRKPSGDRGGRGGGKRYGTSRSLLVGGNGYVSGGDEGDGGMDSDDFIVHSDEEEEEACR